MGEMDFNQLVNKTVDDEKDAASKSFCAMRPANDALLPAINDFRQAKKDLSDAEYKEFTKQIDEKLQFVSCPIGVDETTNGMITVGKSIDVDVPGTSNIFVNRYDKDNHCDLSIVIPNIDATYRNGHLSEGMSEAYLDDPIKTIQTAGKTDEQLVGTDHKSNERIMIGSSLDESAITINRYDENSHCDLSIVIPKAKVSAKPAFLECNPRK